MVAHALRPNYEFVLFFHFAVCTIASSHLETEGARVQVEKRKANS